MTRAKTKSKTDELLDELLEGCDSPEDIFGKHGLVKQLTKRLVERALRAELTEHLGYAPHAPAGRGSGNTRNGHSAKTVQTANGDLPLEVPRDRQGRFEPLLVPKRQRRLEGFAEKTVPKLVEILHGSGVHVTQPSLSRPSQFSSLDAGPQFRKPQEITKDSKVLEQVLSELRDRKICS